MRVVIQNMRLYKNRFFRYDFEEDQFFITCVARLIKLSSGHLAQDLCMKSLGRKMAASLR